MGIVNPSAPTFSDVGTSNPFFKYVETAVQHHIISGYNCTAPPAGAMPGKSLSQRQCDTWPASPKIVVGAMGWTLANPATPTFNDVTPINPFYKYVETAVQRAILGVADCGAPGEACPGKYYRPGNNATR